MLRLFRVGKCMKWKWDKRRTAWAATVGIILCGCLLFWPVSEKACRDGVAEAVTVSWYELGVPGGDTLYFNALRADSEVPPKSWTG